MQYLIDDSDSLAALRKRQLPAGSTRIVLGGPFANDDVERRLNRAYFACGCEEGSVAVLLALIASAFGAVTTGWDGAFTWWRIAAYVSVAALAGKGVGLAWARVRLGRVHRHLAAMAETSSPSGTSVPAPSAGR